MLLFLKSSNFKPTALLVILTIWCSQIVAQELKDSIAPIKPTSVPLKVTLDKGVKFSTPDDVFGMTIRFRIQNRFGFSVFENQDNYDFTGIEARIRRARLRLDGHLINKKLEYHIQLSFSRADMDWDNSGVPNVLRDAFCTYKFTPNFELIFGQTKLPGNRQRFVSSGDLQFVDRSIVNATYNIDRDFLLQLKKSGKLGIEYILKTTVSNGEGRNSNIGNGGACYSARLELLPLGKFTDGGENVESDLSREEKPKISIAGGASFNDQAVRTSGQLGREIKNPTSLTVYHADMMFKYKGISSYTEWMQRSSSNVFPDINNILNYVSVGQGFMTQIGYLWKSNYEIAFRYAQVSPDSKLYENSKVAEKALLMTEYSIAGSKYYKKHNVKLQSDITYGVGKNLFDNTYPINGWTYRIQLQLAI